MIPKNHLISFWKQKLFQLHCQEQYVYFQNADKMVEDFILAYLSFAFVEIKIYSITILINCSTAPNLRKLFSSWFCRFSWIHLDDIVNLIYEALCNPSYKGNVFNLLISIFTILEGSQGNQRINAGGEVNCWFGVSSNI